MILSQFRHMLLCGVFFMTFPTFTHAQEQSLDALPSWLRDRAIVMEIAARIIEQDQEIVWNSENTKVTIPGRPVGIRLVGTNIIVAVSFTPFFRPRGNNFLVAQGQIWIQIPNQGMSFHTCLEAIPMDFNELIYFFPLGSSSSEQDAQIEIQIVLYPYTEESLEQARSQ